MADMQQSARGATVAAISTGLVGLHHEYYGKGPSKAKTYLMDDTVVCVLQEGFTTVERTLIDGGDATAVHHMRRSFQDAMEERFTKLVEGATGRTVIAYLSQVHVDPDVDVEIFLLEPNGGPPRGEHEPEVGIAGGNGHP